MECETVRERLPAAVLFDLPREEMAGLHAHLAGCASCLEEEAELQQALRLLRAHAEEEPTPGLAERVVSSALAAREEGPAEGGETGWRPESFPAHGAWGRREPGRLAAVLLTAAATALLVVGLQTVRESWPASPLSAAGIGRPAAASPGADRSPLALLKGTLFDRGRSLPAAERTVRWRLTRGGGR